MGGQFEFIRNQLSTDDGKWESRIWWLLPLLSAIDLLGVVGKSDLLKSQSQYVIFFQPSVNQTLTPHYPNPCFIFLLVQILYFCRFCIFKFVYGLRQIFWTLKITFFQWCLCTLMLLSFVSDHCFTWSQHKKHSIFFLSTSGHSSY